MRTLCNLFIIAFLSVPHLVSSAAAAAAAAADHDDNVMDQRRHLRKNKKKEKKPQTLSMLGFILDVSGLPTGYDNDKHDFDIVRDLAVLAGITKFLGDPKDGGLSDINLLAPWDEAFENLARELGYRGGYDEQAIFDYIVEAVEDYANKKNSSVPEVLQAILLYHVTDKRKVKAMQKKGRIMTKNGGEIYVEKISDGRTRIQDAVPRYPKLQNKFQDILTRNGFIHVLKDVLIPVNDLM